ncbi:TolB-like protein [Shimia isoporae]|uniref:TolB-like protein n=1 Tax=Shimia isoporae TaxID=647720 RepID=A0A4R1N994_9RHOB|nr:hypothetical protein [Shimia isoporae]TCL00352.1 TolB-like protein [Shimia isoporae]
MQEIASEEILAQLSRMVGSPDFTAGPRVKTFFSHLVNEELEGRGAELRGTALAMDVFGRGGNFDSNNDPVVRIEATKLRKAIEHYYLTAGAQDTLRIDVPKGQYRPVFAKVAHKPVSLAPATLSAMPSIGVRDFEGGETPRAGLYRQGLPEEIAMELSRFDNLRVYSGWDAGADIDGQPATASALQQCDYLLSGNVRDSGSRMRITVQLKRTDDNLLVWSERFDLAVDSDDAFSVQEDIARQCATRLVDAYGVVGDDLAARYAGRDKSDASVYEALLAFHGHLRRNRLDSLKEFVDIADKAVQGNPKSGLAHALLALGYLDRFLFGDLKMQEVLRTGGDHAERAVSLSPQGQEALFAGAVYAMLRKDRARFHRLSDAAISVNPNGSLLIAMAGGWYAILGKAEEGADLVRRATENNPILPVWTNITLALEDIANERYEDASTKLRFVDARDCANDWLMIAAAHALAGEKGLAQEALSKVSQHGVDFEEQLLSLPINQTLADKLIGALKVV